MSLSDYKNEVSLLASGVTILQMFSPMFICRDIIKQRSTDGIDPMPFIGGMAMSILILQNGIIIQDSATVYVNSLGFVLNFIYVLVYCKFTNHKGGLSVKILKAVAFVAVLIAYAQKEHKELVEFRFGLIITVLLIALIASPLLNTSTIITTEDASSLPIPLIISGTAVAFCWFLYGVILKNTFMVIQNVIALILSIFQLGLYVKYWPKKSKASQRKSTLKKSKLKAN